MTPIAVAADESDPRSQNLSNGLQTSIITRDGDDAYRVTRPNATAIEVTAPTSNRNANLRMAVVAADAPVTIDQQSCTTWHGPLAGSAQPGIVLRARTDDIRTQLIMVSNNVFYGWRAGINVHLIDSEVWPEAVQQIMAFTSNHVGDHNGRHPLPWRFCARAVGDRVSAKAWSTSGPEPSWNDPTATLTVTVPPEFVRAGRPGVYVGHLPPGQTSRFEDHTGTALCVFSRTAAGCELYRHLLGRTIIRLALLIADPAP